MIRQIDIENFRSIKKQSIPVKKLNILYGPNGAGKSSVMYAPYVFRNLCVNPNQRLDNLFNLSFIHLGGFDNVLSNDGKENDNYINISIANEIEIYDNKGPQKADFKYSLVLENEEMGFWGPQVNFKLNDIYENISFALPYSLTTKKEITLNNFSFLWNGLTFENINNTESLTARVLNKTYEAVKNLELISVKRGFFNPIFSTEQPTEESEFAFSIRQQEKDFESKIDHYFKQIFDKTFRFVAIPGSTSFYLRTQNKKGFTTDLVNEGFGVNQTIYMLIKLLKRSTSLAFIEEPEIHLHPSAQNKLVDVFTEIIQKEGKQIFLTTHSENIASSVLNKIAKGELSTNDVQFYLAEAENDETKIIPQTVNEKGQIEGGLLSFMETELANLKTLLGV
ncbi:MAG: AAA family ATPase [Chitinophagaceae bacterium]|nr:AAA family ATPase [Chitinophagaceae bacterium]